MEKDKDRWLLMVFLYSLILPSPTISFSTHIITDDIVLEEDLPQLVLDTNDSSQLSFKPITGSVAFSTHPVENFAKGKKKQEKKIVRSLCLLWL
jgi:hypothetical protein